jgi:glycosyltransferase involved in cell wall biosynthesis
MSIYIPDISIIICSYNHSLYLERCIRSLTHQINISQDQYEIIVVDDGSTDDTHRVLNNFSFIPNLKIIKNEKNIGLPTSLNKAINHARGRYLVRVDSDDYVSRQFLSLSMLFLDMNREYQAVAVDYSVVDKFENFIRKVNCFNEEIACGIMFRKECLFEIELYNENFIMREGHELRNRFIEKFKMGRLEFPLYKYRQHESNRTKNEEELRKYEIKLNIETARINITKKYNLVAGNNINLICEKLYENKSLDGTFVECGVFKGNTIIAIAEFMNIVNCSRKIFGFDTFSGFPDLQINEKDLPAHFNNLLNDNLITKDHYDKASKRTNNFSDTSHLKSEYFQNIGDILNIAKNYNINLIDGKFSDTLKNFNEKIAFLFIDCDLYNSYLDCLNNLYHLIIPGGIIIFDEYYSLKYPGALSAVKEFFKDKLGKFEKIITEDKFERVYFIKE